MNTQQFEPAGLAAFGAVSPGLGREKADAPPKRVFALVDGVAPAAVLDVLDAFPPPNMLVEGVVDVAPPPPNIFPVVPAAGVEAPPNKLPPVPGVEVFEALAPLNNPPPSPVAGFVLLFVAVPNKLPLVGAAVFEVFAPNKPPPVDAGVPDAAVFPKMLAPVALDPDPPPNILPPEGADNVFD
jgi:hypothetical protein